MLTCSMMRFLALLLLDLCSCAVSVACSIRYSQRTEIKHSTETALIKVPNGILSALDAAP